MDKQDFSNIKEGTLIKVKYGRKEKVGYYFKTRLLWKFLGSFELRDKKEKSFNYTEILRYIKVKSFEILENPIKEEQDISKDIKEVENYG